MVYSTAREALPMATDKLYKLGTSFKNKLKNSLPPVNWRWVEEGDGYVGRLQPHGFKNTL
jgi:hypothetical protein